MKLNRVAALAMVALLPLVGACETSIGSGGGADVVIGADLEITGALEGVGTAYRNALQLEVDNINADGGILGGRKLRLSVKDNHSDPAVAATDIADFTGDPSIAAIMMGGCGECAISSAKTIDAKGVPTISLSPATGVAQPVADRRFLFKVGPNAQDGALMMANELKAEHVKTIGLVSTDDATGKDSTDAISVAVGKLGITVKSPQTFKATQTDVSQEISEALQHPIDALVISAFPAQALSAAQAARTLGYHGKIFFDQTAAGDLFLTGTKGAAIAQAHMVGTESLVIDDVIATTPADVSRRQWFNDYTSKFGNFSGYSTYAADAIQIIAKAATAAGGTSNHGTLRQQIEITQFDGLSGQIRITPDNHSGLTSQALALLISIDDRWRLA